MSDSYQAIYDAVRSRISGGNIGDIVLRAAQEAFDWGHARMLLQEQIGMVGNELSRPAVVFKPELKRDGNMWCALLGTNLQEGVAGFGETPAAAMTAFDQAFYHEKLPTRCKRCNGTGAIDAPTSADDPGCPDCAGEGLIYP